MNYYEYVAAAVLDKMRCGDLPSSDVANELNAKPLIGFLRARVTRDDVAWLLDLSAKQPPFVAGFALTLLGPFAHEEQLSVKLQDIFERHSDPYVRTILTWRLLDNPKLPAYWNEVLCEHLLQNREIARQQILAYYRPLENPIGEAKSLIADETKPLNKKWIYLFNLAELIEDGQELERVLFAEAATIGVLFGDPNAAGSKFASEVAVKLVKRHQFSE